MGILALLALAWLVLLECAGKGQMEELSHGGILKEICWLELVEAWIMLPFVELLSGLECETGILLAGNLVLWLVG